MAERYLWRQVRIRLATACGIGLAMSVPTNDDVDAPMLDPFAILTLFAAASMGMVSAWYGIGIVARLWCDARIRRATVGRGRIMLTYDDGPGRSATPALLDLLRDHDAKATFFLIGDSAERDPDIVERLAAEGHTIGWHSQTHLNQWKTAPGRAFADVWKPRGLLAGGPTRATVFRPPFGKMNLGTVLAAWLQRLPIVTWTHVSGDTFLQLPESGSIVEQVRRSGGGVVLMHDMDREDRFRPEYVLRLTEELIALANDEGWELFHATSSS